jgi:hypothetical protein
VASSSAALLYRRRGGSPFAVNGAHRTPDP